MTAAAVPCNACAATVTVADAVWVKDGHPVVRCPSCTLLFRLDPPQASEVAAIYGAQYFSSGGHDLEGQGYLDYIGDEGQHRLNARRRLEWLKGRIEPGRLFDVGCAAGFFMDEARTDGWTVEGIDVAPEMARHGREQLGMEIAEGLFDPAALAAGSWDCVTMWDYLEHTLDPARELAGAFRALRPSGLLALSTGDAGSLHARLLGRRWHLLTPRHHNFFFSRGTLGALLRRAGFTVEVASARPAHYSVAYLAHKLRTISPPVGRAADRLVRGRLAAAVVPVNLFDIVTVLARRSDDGAR